MQLLYTKRSPFARKVRVIALEKGIPLELIDEDLQKKSQRLLTANPLGKVPTLILDNGTTIFDSPVICQYLDSLNDNPIMVPRCLSMSSPNANPIVSSPNALVGDPLQERLQVLKWEAFADDLMVAAINLYMEKVRHPEDFHKDFSAAMEKNILSAYGYIENGLSRLKEFNLAPVAVASAIGYVHFRLPHLKVQGHSLQWFEEISQRPSMAQTVPEA